MNNGVYTIVPAGLDDSGPHDGAPRMASVLCLFPHPPIRSMHHHRARVASLKRRSYHGQGPAY